MIRPWPRRFGPACASALRHRRPKPGGKRHLDEVFVEVQGRQRYLWRAVDADGNVLGLLLQNRRDEPAARRFFRKLMKKTPPVPRVIVTGKLRSHGAAHREETPSAEHRSHKGLNNRAENSHQPTRQRERAMKGFPVRRRNATASSPCSAASHPASGRDATPWPPSITAPG